MIYKQRFKNSFVIYDNSTRITTWLVYQVTHVHVPQRQSQCGGNISYSYLDYNHQYHIIYNHNIQHFYMYVRVKIQLPQTAYTPLNTCYNSYCLHLHTLTF